MGWFVGPLTQSRGSLLVAASDLCGARTTPWVVSQEVEW